MRIIQSVFVLLSGLSGISWGQTDEYREVVVSSRVVSLEADLNRETVICSEADYGALYLKILIPQLKDITILDHRNEGAGAPCVAAGMCGDEVRPGPRPDDVIDVNNPKERIDVEVVLTRQQYINHALRTCEVDLRENIRTQIRGLEFLHERWAYVGSRNYLDCL